MERVTATEAARSLSDLLNRVRYRGESFLLLRNGEEVGCLVPVSAGSPKSLRDLVTLIRDRGWPDEEFAADLETIRREQPGLPPEPWPSS